MAISCYIRSFNEARTIKQVVEAAKQVADEVVLVDLLSTDDTVALAEAAGAKVHRQAWLGYGAQKTFAEAKCKHDWLLSIDADEVITPELAAEIRALFATGEPPHSVYAIRIVTAPPFGPPWWEFGVVKRDRLYDKRKLRMPDHAAWDQLKIPAGMKVGELKGPVLHYTIADVAQFSEKLNKVSSVHAREARLKPYWLVCLRVLLAPPLYFFRHYVTRGFWRGGLYGFAMACVLAHARWLKDVKMLEIHLAKHQQTR